MRTIPYAWNNELLEPVLITYNRAKHLKATLTAFLEAGLTNMRLHVLDNASTDDTPKIVKAMQKRWPNLQYHRNVANIGGNANILRAAEIAQSKYHWVIGDDDHWLWNKDNIAEVQKVLKGGQAGIVRLGWLVSDSAKGKLESGRKQVLSEPLFFCSLSMISSVITRRDMVVEHLARAYQNLGDNYPQLVPPIVALIEQDVRVYAMQHDIVVHMPSDDPGYLVGDFEWVAGWFRTSALLAASGGMILEDVKIDETLYGWVSAFLALK